MKRTAIKVMTLALFFFFLVMMVTGLIMRFGLKPEVLQEVHGISGMIFILLVFVHWYFFGKMFIALLSSKNKHP